MAGMCFSVLMVGCRCHCGAAKCQGYLEADSAQNRAALLMEADSGLDDALVSFMLAHLDKNLLACNREDCKGLVLY